MQNPALPLKTKYILALIVKYSKVEKFYFSTDAINKMEVLQNIFENLCYFILNIMIPSSFISYYMKHISLL